MKFKRLIKFTAVFALLTTISVGLQAQTTEGVDFFHGTWAEAMAKAKKENKIIFVDAYTVWCGPCKFMSASVFTRKDVGDLYNKKFINVKLDMEKGEGPTFANTYKVRAYPTLLFINGSGTEVARHLGAKPPEQFIEIGKSVGGI